MDSEYNAAWYIQEISAQTEEVFREMASSIWMLLGQWKRKISEKDGSKKEIY